MSNIEKKKKTRIFMHEGKGIENSSLQFKTQIFVVTFIIILKPKDTK